MKFRLALLVAASLLPLAWWALGPRGADPVAGTRLDFGDRGHPVLLVGDADAGGPWPEWVNLLTDAWGGCDLLPVESFASALDGRDLLVLPRAIAPLITGAVTDTVERFVERGLVVLVEAPDSTLCRRFGLELAAVEGLTELPWPRVALPTAREMRPRPPDPVAFAWTRWRYAPSPWNQETRPEVRLSLDGRPLGWCARRGDGAWFVLAMDLADLSRRSRLEAAADQPGTDAPFLLAWSEGIFGAELGPRPLARLGRAPFEADGWVVPGPIPPPPAPDAAAADARRAASTEVPFLLAPGPQRFGAAAPPYLPLARDGRPFPVLELPWRLDGRTLESGALDRVLRFNATEAAAPVVVAFADSAASLPLEALARRRTQRLAPAADLAAWWAARSTVRLLTTPLPDGIEIEVADIGDANFGIVLPVRWGERALAGWDADWGIARSRPAQRFARAVRIFELDSRARGGRLRVRWE